MFDVQKSASQIRKAINTVLEAQQVEWIMSGTNSSASHAACAIGLTEALIDEVCNFHAMQKMIEEDQDIDYFQRFFKSHYSKEIQELREIILQTQMDLITNGVSWTDVEHTE